jgi:hypothetical protein
MAEHVQRVEYYYATLDDTPGTGARVMSTLKDAGVNLLAFLAFPVAGKKSQLDLVPQDPTALIKAAGQAGISLSETKWAFFIQGEDRVGAVTGITSQLAGAGINITAAAAVGAGSGRFGMIVWVDQRDYNRAAAALGI